MTISAGEIVSEENGSDLRVLKISITDAGAGCDGSSGVGSFSAGRSSVEGAEINSVEVGISSVAGSNVIGFVDCDSISISS